MGWQRRCARYTHATRSWWSTQCFCWFRPKPRPGRHSRTRRAVDLRVTHAAPRAGGAVGRVPGTLLTMPTMADVRGWALSLPESTESPHHGIGSFRVRGRIFATVPDDQRVRIMVDELEIRAATASHPDACLPVHWGKRLSCVAVDIGVAPAGLIRELLTEAWLRKAPASLAKTFTDSE